MTTMADEIDARTGTQDAWTQLRALREVERLGLTRVSAADLAEGRQVLDIGRPEAPHFRTLLRGEPSGWAAGLAGPDIDQVLAVAGETVPDLLTLEEAGKLLPSVWDKQGTPRDSQMTADGVGYLVQTGDLYALYALDGVRRGQYGTRRRRYVFALQVAWNAADRRAKALKLADARPAAIQSAADEAEAARVAWMQVRGLLPDVHRPSTLRVDVTPQSAPLVVTGSHEATRQRRALLIGDKQGWFEFIGPVDGGYQVVVPGRAKGTRQRRRGAEPLTIPAGDALAYVLGAADRQRPSQGRLVAYREGLG